MLASIPKRPHDILERRILEKKTGAPHLGLIIVNV
jgi:hypothetical protein